MSDICTKTLHHIIKNCIGLITKPALTYLQAHMPVTQMVGETGQQSIVVGFHLRNSLVSGVDLDLVPVLTNQHFILMNDLPSCQEPRKIAGVQL